MAIFGRAFPIKGVWLSKKPIAAAGGAFEIVVDAGSYAVTGQDVTLTHAWVVPVDAGSYAVTGQDVTLTHSWVIPVDAGSYAITGQDVALDLGKTVVVDAGSYAVTGTDVDLLLSRLVVVDGGSYAITGNDVDLTLDTGGVIVLPEQGGTPSRGGGKFKRKDWRKLLDELQSEIDAVEAAALAREEGPAKKKLESAAKAAQDVVDELQAIAERAAFGARAVSLKLALDAAAGAAKTQKVIADADHALRLALALKRQLEDDEEEELIVLMAMQ